MPGTQQSDSSSGAAQYVRESENIASKKEPEKDQPSSKSDTAPKKSTARDPPPQATMNGRGKAGGRQESTTPVNTNGGSDYERNVAVTVDPTTKTATEHYDEQQTIKKTEDVTVHQIQIIKKRKSKDAALVAPAHSTPEAVEAPQPQPSHNIPVVAWPPSSVKITEYIQNKSTHPAVVNLPQQTVPVQKATAIPQNEKPAQKTVPEQKSAQSYSEQELMQPVKVTLPPPPVSLIKERVPSQPVRPFRPPKVTNANQTINLAPPSDPITVTEPLQSGAPAQTSPSTCIKNDTNLSTSYRPVRIQLPPHTTPLVKQPPPPVASFQNHTPEPPPKSKSSNSSATERLVPVQRVLGSTGFGRMSSNVFEKPRLKERVGERTVPVKIQGKPEEGSASTNEISDNGGRVVPVKYLSDAAVQDEYFMEREMKERQTFTFDRVQFVRTSKKKNLPMKVDITPKELSEAELSVQKKPASPPKQRKLIVYRNEAKPVEISNFRKLERRVSDSAIERPSSRNANTQTLSRSFLYSSLRKKARTPQPQDVVRGGFDGSSPRPNYAYVKVANVAERRVKSVSPAPLQLPVYIHRSSVSSESTLEPESPEPQFATLKVVCPPQGRQVKSNAPTLIHAVTKIPASPPPKKSPPPPINRETQTSPTYPSSNTVEARSPSHLHATYNPRKLLSPSPTSSISSWGTSELCRVDSYPLSPPDSSFGSWSSLPCPSLSSVTSQCDTDCLVIADARTGVIPDALSDAETDELLDADPFARRSNAEIYMGKSKRGKELNPPELKVNDTPVCTAGKSSPKRPQEVVAPALLDESAAEHSIFNTSQETVILNQELNKVAEEIKREIKDDEQTKQPDVNDGCAQNYMSFYSLYVYPDND